MSLRSSRSSVSPRPCSYFFEGEPVHLVDVRSRAENATIQSWTASYVPGRRFIGKEVYVLTSPKTHSAAEEFAYNLQTLKRAIIVGEVTRGGAHPTGRYRLTEHFGIAVPEAQAVSPITKTNWEGVGIQPDVRTSAETALKTAHRMALEHILKSNPTSKRAPDLERLLADLRGGAQ